MGPPSLAEASLDRLIRGLQVHQHSCRRLLDLAVDTGEAAERLPFPDIHHQRRPVDVRGPPAQLRERLHQVDRQIVDRIVASVFQGPEDGPLSRAAQPGQDYQAGP